MMGQGDIGREGEAAQMLVGTRTAPPGPGGDCPPGDCPFAGGGEEAERHQHSLGRSLPNMRLTGTASAPCRQEAPQMPPKHQGSEEWPCQWPPGRR